MHRPPVVAPIVLVLALPMPVLAQSNPPTQAASSPSSPNLNAEFVP